MKNSTSRLKSLSAKVCAILLVLAAFFIIIAITEIAGGVPAGANEKELATTVSRVILMFMWAATLAFMATIFNKISKSETPFFAGIGKRMKLAALFVFASVELPQWAGYTIISIKSGRLIFTVINEASFVALIVALVIYCFALVFDYGVKIQDENYEIL